MNLHRSAARRIDLPEVDVRARERFRAGGLARSGLEI